MLGSLPPAASWIEDRAISGDRRHDVWHRRCPRRSDILDPRFGCFVNHDLAEYHVPVHADVLNVDAIFLPELDAESNPLKSKGVGELGICGAGGSIANAIYNACGVRVRDYPITLDKLNSRITGAGMKDLPKGAWCWTRPGSDEPESSWVDGVPVMDMKVQDWSSTALNPVGLIIQQKDPNDFEMPFDQLGDFIAPSELFYIRSHFPYLSWIQRPFDCRYGASAEAAEPEVRRYPRHAFRDMLRHTGMRWQQPGAARARRAMGTRRGRQCGMDWRFAVRTAGKRRTGRWRVRHRFGRCRPRRADGRAEAAGSDLLCPQYREEAGNGTGRSHPLPDERAGSYAGLRISFARHRSWLLRHVVGQVVDRHRRGHRAVSGYWQTSDYGYWDHSEGIPCAGHSRKWNWNRRSPVPVYTSGCNLFAPTLFFGVAWAGDTDVTEIWISLDGGVSWDRGDFIDPIRPHACRRWKYDWITPVQPGRYTLLARAIGADQRTQPDGHIRILASTWSITRRQSRSL